MTATAQNQPVRVPSRRPQTLTQRLRWPLIRGRLYSTLFTLTVAAAVLSPGCSASAVEDGQDDDVAGLTPQPDSVNARGVDPGKCLVAFDLLGNLQYTGQCMKPLSCSIISNGGACPAPGTPYTAIPTIGCSKSYDPASYCY